MIRELNQRTTNYGLTVALLWEDSTDEIFVELETEESWDRFQVPNESANDAFAHPFVYQAKFCRRHPDFSPVATAGTFGIGQ